MFIQQICTCTIAFREMSFEKTLEHISQIGFKYLEASAEIENHLMPYVDAQFKLGEIRKLIKSYGLKTVAISGCNDFTLESAKLSEQIQWVKKEIDLTKKLGAGILRIFAGHVKLEDLKEKHYHQVKKCFKEISDYARIKGIKLAMENHYGITATAEQIFKIMDGMDSSVIGLNLDPANFLPSGQDPVGATRELAKHVIHMHVKDCHKTKDGYKYCAAGKGDVDWRSILEIMKESDYSGYLSLEYEDASNPVEGTRESMEYINRVLSEL